MRNFWMMCCWSWSAAIGLTGCASNSGLVESYREDVGPAQEGEGEEGEGEGSGGTEGEGEGTGHRPDGGGSESDASGMRGFNEPCDHGSQCASGFCVNNGGSSVCTRLCSEEDCPMGWACKGVTNFGSDLTFVCAPLAETLCQPCRQDQDCGPLSSDLCLDIGGNRRCGRDCADGRDCPPSYECQAVDDPRRPGQQAKQCLPVNGRCGCTIQEVGTSRPCQVENQHGRCQGIEFCDADLGWINCTAAIPRPEECDGMDNDCDMTVDEGMDGTPCEIRNGFGVCPGRLKCNGMNGKVCEGQTPSLEVCDGIDNDCNDQVDDGLCFDGNPCTRDICSPDAGCTYPPLAGPCDDGSVCTENDHCVNGQCTGATKNCDDNNPCTDDRCDPVGGCQHPNNNARCSTGNPCTADFCQGGECRRGGPILCDDGNPCTDDRCDPNQGCVFPAIDGRPCDDDDACTSRSACGGGRCVGTEQFCQSECNCLLYTCLPLGSIPLCTCLCVD